MTRPLTSDSDVRKVSSVRGRTNQLERRPALATAGGGGGAVFEIKVVADDELVVVGDGQFKFDIPADLDGIDLMEVYAWVTTVSSSGKPSVQIRNNTAGFSMLSTVVSIDASEKNSKYAAVPAVIDTAHDTVADADEIWINVTVAGTGAMGLGVTLVFGDPPSGGGLVGPTGATGPAGPTGPAGADATGFTATDTIWDAKGDLAGGTGANTAARLPVGTDGQVLVADSTQATGMKWTSGGGGLVLIEQHTASASATLDFTSLITSAYDEYVFELVGLVPVTNAVDFLMQFSIAGSWDGGSHYINNHLLQATSGNVSVVATSTAFRTRNNGEITNSAAQPITGRLTLLSPQSTSLVKHLTGNIYWSGGSNWVNTIFHGVWNQSGSAVDGVRFFYNSGNIASGTIRAYGLAK